MKSESSVPAILGIEGGGTRTVALLADARGNLLRRVELGPANLHLMSDPDLLARFRDIRLQLGIPQALGIFLAGARSSGDCDRIRTLAHRLWPGVPLVVGNDLDSGLAAAPLAPASHAPLPRVLVLSGTGSCAFGLDPKGRAVKSGGWGHLLGDRGSAYAIGHQALREALIEPFDRTGALGIFGKAVLKTLALETPDALVGWIHHADKAAVAALAPIAIQASRGDRLARHVVQRNADQLADDAAQCARQATGSARAPVEFVFAGGLLTSETGYRQRVEQAIRSRRHRMTDRVTVLARESAWGAVELARRVLRTSPETDPGPDRRVQVQSSALSPTEERNPRSMNLDRLPIPQAIELMLSEEAHVVPAIRTQLRPLSRLVLKVAQALGAGGRLFYVGAGTSGRLGFLDASECPPTFRTPPEWVQGIIAGGRPAIWSAVEGAEDNHAAGAESMREHQIGDRDVVVGLAASGRTPFVLGALAEARVHGAWTCLVSCNPRLRLAPRLRPDLSIAIPTGPEVLTGSTRLKAGTATKIVLNLITTLAMTRLGKVRSNLMIDLNASNEKLRARAVRIVCELAPTDEMTALHALERAGWRVKDALQSLARKRRRR